MIDSIDDIIPVYQMKWTDDNRQMTATDDNRLIINDFDASDTDVSKTCEFLDSLTRPETDTSGNVLNSLAGQSYCCSTDIQLNINVHKLDPIAATFTFKTDYIYRTVENIRYTQTGRKILSKKSLLLIDAPQAIQWSIFKQHFMKLCERVYKKHYMNVFGYEIYPEFTKKGLIHCHGVLWIRGDGWLIGKSHALANEWARITKGNMKSQISYNADGTADYAFAPCKDIDAWLKYSKKEYNKYYDNLIDRRVKEYQEFKNKL